MKEKIKALKDVKMEKRLLAHSVKMMCDMNTNQQFTTAVLKDLIFKSIANKLYLC